MLSDISIIFQSLCAAFECPLICLNQISGLSLYYTTVDNFQLENNRRIYTCDGGMTIIYYPGNPVLLEISDGDYAGLYEEASDKVKSESHLAFLPNII